MKSFDPIVWATSPWGRTVALHVAWVLIWVALLAGVGFMVVHALYVAFAAGPKQFAPPGAATGSVPARVPRHSLAARLFHWIMAASMLVLLFTAFLPKLGVHFNWVVYHWIAGLVLTASILFHIVHASFVLDFKSIWPDRADLEDARRRVSRFLGRPAPPPRRFGKYPLDNKLYHLAIVCAGLAVIGTGVFMLKRVRTGFLVRNPYLFSDRTWGMVYVLHGLAGVGLIALIMVHIYMALRPEKLAITRGMVQGWMARDFYLEEHDPQRWPVASARSEQGGD
jgi:cytochrome b subunit of formate dehydrogenase